MHIAHKFILAASAGLSGLMLPMGLAQTSIAKSTTGSIYISPGSLPFAAQEYLRAFGARIQTRGNERTVLAGTFTDSRGSVAATMTWEAPGKLRFDRGVESPAFIFDTSSGVINSASLVPSDLDILESLLDDRSEAFLYSFREGRPLRFLGSRFRTDGLSSGKFSGPWYDIYEELASVKAAGGNTVRQKYFCFDSDTKLLARTTYLLKRGSSNVTISTEYSNWTSQAGQAIPDRLFDARVGAVIFTFKTITATIGPAVSDGIFSKQ